MTTIAAPMVHDTIPVLGIRSYLNKPQLPYLRLPGFQDIKKNDITVFSWPADTVRVFFKKEEGVKKPIDKKSNYVKRTVGTPGDSLQIIDGYVYINGKQLQLSDRAKPQYEYRAYAQKGVSSRLLLELGVDEFMRYYITSSLNQNQAEVISQYALNYDRTPQGEVVILTKSGGIPTDAIRRAGLSLREVTDRQRTVTLTDEMAEKLRSNPTIDSLVKILAPAGKQGYNIFPQNPAYPWNNDNFGPIYIPGSGDTVPLDTHSLPLYKKIIRDYEGNTVNVSGNQVIINGEAVDSYTFKQDYYWMMGDNRHHSEDSRAWGYVPANHIVGKPIFIWLSFDNFKDGIASWRPRWDRIFTTVGGDGEPRSYFKHFLILLAAYFVFDYFWRRRKKAKK
jgi:signal peptidase I